MNFDQGLLEAALVGLELKKARLEEQIAAIRALTGGKNPASSAKARAAANDDWEAPLAEAAKKPKRKTKRNLSPEARERISAAQKQRWAAYRGES